MSEVLLLTYEDVSRLLSITDVIKYVEEAFREKGLKRVQMPPKIYLNFHKYNGDLRVMPAYFESLDIAGVKIVNSHMNNRKYGLPTVMALIEIVEPKTGKPLAVMDGTLITLFRTGAASAIATKYLANKDSRVLGIVGAGAQSYTQVEAITSVMTIEEVRIFDINRQAADRLATYVSERRLVKEVVIDNDIRTLSQNSDIITTLTPSRSPLVFLEWIKKGVHFNAIGADAPGKQELDPKILKVGKIIVDDIEQTVHSGEINVPISKGILSKEDIYGELGEVVAGLKQGRTEKEEITIFDSTGLAILDVITGYYVYKKAVDNNIGIKSNLVKTK